MPRLGTVASERFQVNFADAEVKAFFGTVRNALILISKAELRNQIALGNSVYITKVDGVERRPIDDARRKVEINFVQAAGTIILDYIRRLAAQFSYDNKGVRRGTGNLGRQWQFFLNRIPVGNVNSIRSLSPTDRLVLWTMVPYGRRMSRYIYHRIGRSLVSRIATELRRQGQSRFRGYYFRALDMPADLGGGRGRVRQAGIMVIVSKKARVAAQLGTY